MERTAVRRASLYPALCGERLDLLEIFGEAALDGVLGEAEPPAPAAPLRKPPDAA